MKYYRADGTPKCRHKWDGLVWQRVKNGMIVAEERQCSKCGTVRVEQDPQPALPTSNRPD